MHQPNDSTDDDIDDFEAAFRNANSEASASTIRSSKTTEQELRSFLACTDVDETANNYFKEKRTGYPKLSECAQNSGPASEASFMTDSRKNRLKI